MLNGGRGRAGGVVGGRQGGGADSSVAARPLPFGLHRLESNRINFTPPCPLVPLCLCLSSNPQIIASAGSSHFIILFGHAAEHNALPAWLACCRFGPRPTADDHKRMVASINYHCDSRIRIDTCTMRSMWLEMNHTGLPGKPAGQSSSRP